MLLHTKTTKRPFWNNTHLFVDGIWSLDLSYEKPNKFRLVYSCQWIESLIRCNISIPCLRVLNREPFLTQFFDLFWQKDIPVHEKWNKILNCRIFGVENSCNLLGLDQTGREISAVSPLWTGGSKFVLVFHDGPGYYFLSSRTWKDENNLNLQFTRTLKPSQLVIPIKRAHNKSSLLTNNKLTFHFITPLHNNVTQRANWSGVYVLSFGATLPVKITLRKATTCCVY